MSSGYIEIIENKVMREIGIEEIKKLQLEMLDKIDAFCRTQNISYYLTYGTLLGAVRHKGYIPWDDDIDIMMLRPDYDKFLQAFNGYYEELTVLAPELNWLYYAPFANVFDNRTLLLEGSNGHNGMEIGVKIDIFPFDAVPRGNVRYHIENKIVNMLNAVLWYKRRLPSKSGFSYKFSILKCIPYQFIQKVIHHIAISQQWGKSEEVFMRKMWCRDSGRIAKSFFGRQVYVPFEQHKFPIPEEADAILRVVYGDYMHLPPEEQRVSHHCFEAYWKD